jgi:hypothetical protein
MAERLRVGSGDLDDFGAKRAGLLPQVAHEQGNACAYASGDRDLQKLAG